MSKKDWWKYEKEYLSKNLKLIAGVDEVGRGSIAGPVMSAAIILPSHFVDFRVSGINDSKLLSKSKREKLFPQIIDQCVCYGIGMVSTPLIDKINIHWASLLSMRWAVQSLSLKPGCVLVDGKFPIKKLNVPQRTIIRGDSNSITIAAASIIAKVTRDRLMDYFHEVYPPYKFNKNKGYFTPDHGVAMKECGITSLHRTTYKQVRQYLCS
jgi:ribonuclease HII